jgi:hypothetical protein
VQDRASLILQAVWEPEFRECSYGFRPGRNAHQAHQRPRTFNFLGFTHYVGKSRKGNFVVGRKTQRERIQKKLKELNIRLAALRVQGGRAMMEFARRHLEGHIQYFGVSGNIRSLRQYCQQVQRLLFKWLNRRSQRRSCNWQRFAEVMKRFFTRTRIVHNLYPSPPWMTQTGSRMV